MKEQITIKAMEVKNFLDEQIITHGPYTVGGDIFAGIKYQVLHESQRFSPTEYFLTYAAVAFGWSVTLQAIIIPTIKKTKETINKIRAKPTNLE